MSFARVFDAVNHAKSTRNPALFASSQSIRNSAKVQISDEGVKAIAKLGTLKSLCLFACNGVTDNGVSYIGTMKSLSSLHISTLSGRISSGSIRCLSALPNLEVLDVYACPGISDDAVEPLAKLKHLVNLDIRGTSISDDGVKRLQRALPKTVILTGEF